MALQPARIAALVEPPTSTNTSGLSGAHVDALPHSLGGLVVQIDAARLRVVVTPAQQDEGSVSGLVGARGKEREVVGGTLDCLIRPRYALGCWERESPGGSWTWGTRVCTTCCVSGSAAWTQLKTAIFEARSESRPLDSGLRGSLSAQMGMECGMMRTKPLGAPCPDRFHDIGQPGSDVKGGRSK